MGIDPMVEAGMKDFLRKPRHEQLDALVIAAVRGFPATETPWLSQGMAQALMMRTLVESSHRLERLTGWLIGLTIVLTILTGTLTYDVVRHLIGN